jgi:hypothetical protein
MISLSNYLQVNEDKVEKPVLKRGDIKFTIWEKPDKKVNWIKSNKDYLKIEYQLKNEKKGVAIDFLLGFKDNSWKLWVGKIGATTYADDPYCSFDTTKFSEAVMRCLDKVEKFVKDVYNNPDNWVQYYIDF